MGTPHYDLAIVDDDVAIRISLVRWLKLLGLEVHAFDSAEDLLRSLPLHQPNQLILDVTLKGISGIELAAALELMGYRIPVVFITARMNTPHLRRELRSFGGRVLFKPFGEAELIQILGKSFEDVRGP